MPQVELLAGSPLAAAKTEHAGQAAVQFDHAPRPGGLMQAIHVLRDDPGQQPAALEFRDRMVPRVRGRGGNMPPATVAARPAPPPGRGTPGERLVRHRLGPPCPLRGTPALRYV